MGNKGDWSTYEANRTLVPQQGPHTVISHAVSILKFRKDSTVVVNLHRRVISVNAETYKLVSTMVDTLPS